MACVSFALRTDETQAISRQKSGGRKIEKRRVKTKLLAWSATYNTIERQLARFARNGESTQDARKTGEYEQHVKREKEGKKQYIYT